MIYNEKTESQNNRYFTIVNQNRIKYSTETYE